MVWERDLAGRQYPVQSRNSYAGRVMWEWCCSSGIDVIEENPAKLARNRRINSVLAPLHAIRKGVEFLLVLPVLLIFYG